MFDESTKFGKLVSLVMTGVFHLVNGDRAEYYRFLTRKRPEWA